MNYKALHDRLIDRAMNRVKDESVYYENHHIIPMCEGGLLSGQTVPLTFKEHRFIHKLRYKITGNIGNLYATNLMSGTVSDRRLRFVYIAQLSHIIFKNRDPESYFKRQSFAGKRGGDRAYRDSLGFFNLSETDKECARKRGTKTTVDNKLGMFSDEYRQIHKEKMKKVVNIDDLSFNSCTEAARYYNVSNALISYWIATNKAKIEYEQPLAYRGKQK